MENAQLRFMVVAPLKDSPFSRDFQSFYNHIRILVDLLNPAATLRPFVTKGDKVDDISFNFSHQLFKAKFALQWTLPDPLLGCNIPGYFLT